MKLSDVTTYFDPLTIALFFFRLMLVVTAVAFDILDTLVLWVFPSGDLFSAPNLADIFDRLFGLFRFVDDEFLFCLMNMP